MQKTILKKSLNLVMCGILSTAVLLGGCGVGNTAEKQKEAVPAAKQEVRLSDARNTPVVVAAQKVGPAVVGITNKAYVRDFFNRVQLTERGTGSGVIYDKSGLIATNNHVVEGAQEIIVSLTDGRSVKGKVLGADAATDLAVVKIDVDGDLPVAELGDSSTLQVGEPAIAIGNPLGLETQLLTPVTPAARSSMRTVKLWVLTLPKLPSAALKASALPFRSTLPNLFWTSLPTTGALPARISAPA